MNVLAALTDALSHEKLEDFHDDLLLEAAQFIGTPWKIDYV